MTDVTELFERDYERLVRSLGVAFDAESAADAVQEAFIQADRRWARVATLDARIRLRALLGEASDV